MKLKHQTSSEDALRDIYEKYFKGLLIYSLSYTHRLDVAEDIVQDVIINFFEKNREENIKGAILPYLRGAVIKASIKHNRDNNRFIFEEIETIANQELCSFIECENQEASIHNLMVSLEKLPKRSKEIVKLIMYEDKKMKQVADELSISVNSVKSQYYKSLDRIRDSLKKTYLFFF